MIHGLVWGRTAVALAVLSWMPAFVPGAMSIIGLSISIAAVVVSLFSVRRWGKKYFNLTLAIFVVGVLLVNDALRLRASIPMPLELRAGLFGVVVAVVILARLLAARLDR